MGREAKSTLHNLVREPTGYATGRVSRVAVALIVGLSAGLWCIGNYGRTGDIAVAGLLNGRHKKAPTRGASC